MQGIGLTLALVLATEPVAAGPDGRWRPPGEPEPLRSRAAGQSGAPAVGPGSCAAFADPDYRGAALRVQDGRPLEWVGRAWDNRLSSVACAPGCRLIAYQHINYGGARATFSGAFARLGEVFDDRISAARVVCGAEPHH